jgi:hypothetical protein
MNTWAIHADGESAPELRIYQRGELVATFTDSQFVLILGDLCKALKNDLPRKDLANRE